MDPYVLLGLELLKLINKIYDDTPPERREENMERWYKFWDDFGSVFKGKKLELLPPEGYRQIIGGSGG